MSEPNGNRTMALNFDAVLHRGRYIALNPPIRGALRAIRRLHAEDIPMVVITALRDHYVVRDWLLEYEFPPLTVTGSAHPSWLTVDEQVLSFAGEWTDESIHRVVLASTVDQGSLAYV